MENMDLKDCFMNLLSDAFDFFSMKSIKENKFQLTGCLFDLHKPDGILMISQKMTV